MNKDIIVIDNYDSFTYNLVHMLEELTNSEIKVVRNDEWKIADFNSYEYIILSPGPGIPSEAGKLKEIIKAYGNSKKIFGVCLGLQAIGEVYGASLSNLDKVYHGIESTIHKTQEKSVILNDISDEFQAGRYHSWVIDKNSISDEFKVTCTDDNGEIMGIEHKDLNIYAVQFHPESIMTPTGKTMIQNFLAV